MCQKYEEQLRTTCKGSRDFDKWELALCQHPMLLLVKEDDLCAERESDWGGDFDEGLRRLDHNLDLVDLHPSLRLCYDFAVCEIELVKDERADLYEKFRKNLKDRKITFVNGTYSQPHMSIMGHESCYQQVEEGCRTMDEMFGNHPRTYATQEPCYIEQLPQILKAFGYDYITLSHFAWSLKFLTPHELLGYRGRLHFLEGEEFTNWISPDGTQLPLYLADVGGPLHGFLKDEGIYWEYHKDLLRAPTLRIGYPDLIDIPKGWLEANEKNGKTVLLDDALDNRLDKYPPESSARLIPTFSYQAEGIDGSRLNILNRKAEVLINQLRAIEAVLDIEKLENVRSYRHIWRIILKCQHHDAYWPGGPGLRKKCENWLRNLNNEMRKRITGRMKLLGSNIPAPKNGGRRLVAFNTIPLQRKGLLKVDVGGNKSYSITDNRGRELPSQIVPLLADKKLHKLLSVIKFDGLGYKSMNVEETKKSLSNRPVNKAISFSNDSYSCKVDPDLTFSSLKFSKTGEELLSKGSQGNEWRGLGLDGIWMTTRGNAVETSISAGPIGKIITASFNLPKAKLQMRAYLLHDLPWIEFEAVMDAKGFSVGDYWKNISKLSTIWPLSSSSEIRYGVPFGSAEGRSRRPLIALGWTDVRLGKASFAYFNHGTPLCFLENDVFRNVIAWGAKTDNFNSRVYGSMKYSKKFDLSLNGRYYYRWAVMPHSPKMSAGDLTTLCQSWMERPVGTVADVCEGSLKPNKTYMKLAPGLVPVSVEKSNSQTKGIRIMAFEANGKKVEASVKSSLPKISSSASLLDGRKIKAFGPHKIGWINLRQK